MLDDNDFGAVGLPEPGAFLIGFANTRDCFGQVIFFSRSENDVGVSCHHGVIDGNFVLVFPGVSAVVNVKDHDYAVFLSKHHRFECGFS